MRTLIEVGHGFALKQTSKLCIRHRSFVTTQRWLSTICSACCNNNKSADKEGEWTTARNGSQSSLKMYSTTTTKMNDIRTVNQLQARELVCVIVVVNTSTVSCIRCVSVEAYLRLCTCAYVCGHARVSVHVCICSQVADY